MIVYNNQLKNQHSSIRKILRQWFELYVVINGNHNVIYQVAEFDGTIVAISMVGKRVKIFRKWSEEDLPLFTFR